jgi:hypothetical protein
LDYLIVVSGESPAVVLNAKSMPCLQMVDSSGICYMDAEGHLGCVKVSDGSPARFIALVRCRRRCRNTDFLHHVSEVSRRSADRIFSALVLRVVDGAFETGRMSGEEKD